MGGSGDSGIEGGACRLSSGGRRGGLGNEYSDCSLIFSCWLSWRPALLDDLPDDSCDVMLQGKGHSLQRAFDVAVLTRDTSAFSLELSGEDDTTAISRPSAMSTAGWPTANAPGIKAKEARSAAHAINAFANHSVASKESCRALLTPIMTRDSNVTVAGGARGGGFGDGGGGPAGG